MANYTQLLKQLFQGSSYRSPDVLTDKTKLLARRANVGAIDAPRLQQNIQNLSPEQRDATLYNSPRNEAINSFRNYLTQAARPIASAQNFIENDDLRLEPATLRKFVPKGIPDFVVGAGTSFINAIPGQVLRTAVDTGVDVGRTIRGDDLQELSKLRSPGAKIGRTIAGQGDTREAIKSVAEIADSLIKAYGLSGPDALKLATRSSLFSGGVSAGIPLVQSARDVLQGKAARLTLPEIAKEGEKGLQRGAEDFGAYKFAGALASNLAKIPGLSGIGRLNDFKQVGGGLAASESARNLAGNAVKRAIRATLIETPFEAPFYGARDVQEGERLEDSIYEELLVNGVMNNFFAQIDSGIELSRATGGLFKSIKESNAWKGMQNEIDKSLSVTPNPARKNEWGFIRIDLSGNKYVDVQKGQGLFEGKKLSEYPKIAQKYLNDNFIGKSIQLLDNGEVAITGKGVGKYSRGSRKLASDALKVKMRLTPEIDNALSVSKFVGSAADKAGAHGNFAKDGFEYRGFEFEIDGQRFRGIANIAKNGEVRKFYDINPIKKSPSADFLAKSSAPEKMVGDLKQSIPQNADPIKNLDDIVAFRSETGGVPKVAQGAYGPGEYLSLSKGILEQEGYKDITERHVGFKNPLIIKDEGDLTRFTMKADEELKSLTEWAAGKGYDGVLDVPGDTAIRVSGVNKADWFNPERATSDKSRYDELLNKKITLQNELKKTPDTYDNTNKLMKLKSDLTEVETGMANIRDGATGGDLNIPAKALPLVEEMRKFTNWEDFKAEADKSIHTPEMEFGSIELNGREIPYEAQRAFSEWANSRGFASTDEAFAAVKGGTGNTDKILPVLKKTRQEKIAMDMLKNKKIDVPKYNEIATRIEGMQEIPIEKLPREVLLQQKAELPLRPDRGVDSPSFESSLRSPQSRQTVEAKGVRQTPLQETGSPVSTRLSSPLQKLEQARQANIVKDKSYRHASSLDTIVQQSPINVKDKVNILDYLRTPDRVLKKVGLAKEAEVIKASYNNYLDELPKEIGRITEWYKRVEGDREASRRIFKYLDGQDIALKGEELMVANEIKSYLRGWADRLGLPEDGRIASYITHIFEKDFIQKEFDPELAKIITDKVPGSVYDPFLEQRLGQQGYVEDTFRALDAYVKRATRKVHMDPALEGLKKASERLDLETLKYVKSYADRINMRPTDFDNLIDNLVKSTPVGYKLGQRPVASVSRKLRQAAYRGTLGLNIGSAIRNLTQGVNTYSELGEKYTAVGYLDTLRAIVTRSPELEEQGVLRNSFIEDRSLSATKKFWENLDKGLFSFFEFAEKVNRGGAYYGAKKKALAAGDSLEEAIKKGVAMARKTQFTFGSVDTPVALQSDAAKLLTQFQSFNVKQTEFLADKVNAKDYAGLLRWFGANTVLLFTLGQAMGWDWNDFVPFGGVLDGQSPIGSSPAITLGKDALTVLTGGQDRYGQPMEASKLLEDLVPLIPGGVQAKKTYQGIKSVNQGASTSKSGRVRYPVEQSTGNYLAGALLGQNVFPEAREYFDKDRSVLGEKQSNIFNSLQGQERLDYYNSIMQEREAKKEAEALLGEEKGGGIFDLFKSKDVNASTGEDTTDAQLEIQKIQFKKVPSTARMQSGVVLYKEANGNIATLNLADMQNKDLSGDTLASLENVNDAKQMARKIVGLSDVFKEGSEITEKQARKMIESIGQDYDEAFWGRLDSMDNEVEIAYIDKYLKSLTQENRDAKITEMVENGVFTDDKLKKMVAADMLTQGQANYLKGLRNKANGTGTKAKKPSFSVTALKMGKSIDRTFKRAKLKPTTKIPKVNLSRGRNTVSLGFALKKSAIDNPFV